VPRAIRECGPALRTCHLHDNLGSADEHLDCGEGVVPWRAVLEALAEVGYRGPLVVELYAGRRGESPGAAVRASREFLGALAGDAWRPAASAAGCDVFRATPADRERARSVMGPRVGRAPEGDGGDGGDGPVEVAAAIATDRFGDAVAWGELSRERDGGGLALEFRGREDPEVARAVSGAVVRLAEDAAHVTGALRAEGAAAEALAALGYERRGEGRFARPAPAGEGPR
jgi:hypothetical protein